MIIFVIIVVSTSILLKFNQLTYSVDEDDGLVQTTLVLSNPSSTDITVQIIDTADTATGKYYK